MNLRDHPSVSWLRRSPRIHSAIHATWCRATRGQRVGSMQLSSPGTTSTPPPTPPPTPPGPGTTVWPPYVGGPVTSGPLNTPISLTTPQAGMSAQAPLTLGQAIAAQGPNQGGVPTALSSPISLGAQGSQQNVVAVSNINALTTAVAQANLAAGGSGNLAGIPIWNAAHTMVIGYKWYQQ